MFYLDHESPSLRHEQIALEEYTVPADYGCVNIWTSKSASFEFIVRWLHSIAPVTYLSKLQGTHELAAFTKSEILRIS
jgi:hypothetical protein